MMEYSTGPLLSVSMNLRPKRSNSADNGLPSKKSNVVYYILLDPNGDIILLSLVVIATLYPYKPKPDQREALHYLVYLRKDLIS